MRTKIFAAVGLVLAIAVGFGLRGLIKTPEEAVLPVPEPEIVAVEVVSQALFEQFSGAGTVNAIATFEVVPPSSSGGVQLVTDRPVSVGDSVPWCRALIEVSDRPLLVLKGSVNPHRNLAEGDEGADVRRLQEGLQKCGYSAVADGTFGPQTAAAVTKLYQDAGYAVPTREQESADGAAQVSATTAAAVIPASTDGGSPSSGAEGTSGSGGSSEGGGQTPSPAPAKKLVTVPASEITYVAANATVTKLLAINTILGSDPVAVLESGDLSVEINLPAGVRTSVEGGERLDVTVGGTAIELVLPEPPIAPVITDAGDAVFPIVIPLPADTEAGPGDEQVSWTLTVGGETVYDRVVPVTAIAAQADGTQAVIVLDGDGTQSTVPVTVIESAGGMVAIEGAVSTGDRVVVGVQ